MSFCEQKSRILRFSLTHKFCFRNLFTKALPGHSVCITLKFTCTHATTYQSPSRASHLLLNCLTLLGLVWGPQALLLKQSLIGEKRREEPRSLVMFPENLPDSMLTLPTMVLESSKLLQNDRFSHSSLAPQEPLWKHFVSEVIPEKLIFTPFGRR